MSNRIRYMLALIALSLGWASLLPSMSFAAEQGQPALAGQTTHDVIRFAPEKDYGPFVFEDASGQIAGLSVDILKAISDTQGLRIINLPAQNLSLILEQAKRGEVDLISSLRPTPERLAYLRFSRPYVEIPAVLISGVGAKDWLSLLDLSAQVVAVGKGYGVESFVREKFPLVYWLAVADDIEALKEVQSGKAQAAVVDLASYHFNRSHFKEDAFQIHGRVGFQYPLSFAYPKEKPEIGEAIEQGLSKLSVARRDALVMRWLGAETQDYVDNSTATLMKLAISGVLIAAVLTLVAVLRKKAVL
jgi:ABC-type amino acid transport substrate-binding protein